MSVVIFKNPSILHAVYYNDYCRLLFAVCVDMCVTLHASLSYLIRVRYVLGVVFTYRELLYCFFLHVGLCLCRHPVL